MAEYPLIVVGASAGGVEALITLTGALPADLSAALLIVLHVAPTSRGVLPSILGRASRLRVGAAIDGEALEPGRVYVAPVDNHLLVADSAVRVVHSARENGHRPAVDPLFRSAAEAHGPRVIGVVLSGMRDCGTAGLMEVKRRGGVAVVQDPTDALFPDMPQSALDNVPVDHCVPLAQIPGLLVKLVQDGAAARALAGERAKQAAVATLMDTPEAEFTCPECGGNLVRSGNGGALNFRCKVGHRYSPDGLEEEQAAAIEAARWIALRAIEDNAALARRLAERAAERNHLRMLAHFEERVRLAEERAALVRRVLLGDPGAAGAEAGGHPRRAGPRTKG